MGEASGHYGGVKSGVKEEANMEPKTESKTQIKAELMDDIDTAIASNGSPKYRIKDEDEISNPDAILKTLPDAENDMFEDVNDDDDEVVDLTYEGIAHIDDVRHFVCEGCTPLSHI